MKPLQHEVTHNGARPSSIFLTSLSILLSLLSQPSNTCILKEIRSGIDFSGPDKQQMFSSVDRSAEYIVRPVYSLDENVVNPAGG